MAYEADTCRRLITPKLLAAGWDTDPHVLSEQRPVTDGRIIPVGVRYKRKAPKKPDYLLSYRRDTTLAVVEAKASDRPAADGLQQAKHYAEMLDLKFAYATNGHEIIERLHDRHRGNDHRLPSTGRTLAAVLLRGRHQDARDRGARAHAVALEPKGRTSAAEDSVPG